MRTVNKANGSITALALTAFSIFNVLILVLMQNIISDINNNKTQQLADNAAKNCAALITTSGRNTAKKAANKALGKIKHKIKIKACPPGFCVTVSIGSIIAKARSYPVQNKIIGSRLVQHET